MKYLLRRTSGMRFGYTSLQLNFVSAPLMSSLAVAILAQGIFTHSLFAAPTPAPTSVATPKSTAVVNTATKPAVKATSVSKPVATPKPVPKPGPKVIPVPKVVPSPRATPAPKVAPKPTATAKPAVTPKPMATPKPNAKPTVAPKPAAIAKPVVIPKPTATAKPTTHPKSSVTPPNAAVPIVSTVRQVKLPNGLTLVLRPDHTAPRFAVSFLVRAGAADETAATAGWRRVLTEAVLRASLADSGQESAGSPASSAPAALTGLQLQRLADATGGSLGASVGDDVIEFWLTGQSQSASPLLELLTTLITRPRLSDADVTAARRRIRAVSLAVEDDIAQAATASLRGQIYRTTSGRALAYGLPPQGTAETLQSLSSGKIRAYYRTFFAPSNVTVAVTGNFDERQVEAHLAKLTTPRLADKTEISPDDIAVRPGAPVFAPSAKGEPILLVQQMPTNDAWIFASYLTAPSNTNDMAALAVLSAALGEAPGARLPRRLLNTRPASLRISPDEVAQQAAVSFTPRRWGSEFVVYAQANAGSVESVKNALLDEVRKLREAPLTATELTRAKNFVRGSWAVDRETLRERAYNAALAPATGASSDISWPARVQSVTAADVRRVAQKYLNAYAVALIMPQG